MTENDRAIGSCHLPTQGFHSSSSSVTNVEAIRLLLLLLMPRRQPVKKEKGRKKPLKTSRDGLEWKDRESYRAAS